MRQAIVCKGFGYTNFKGPRVKATCMGGSVTLNRDGGSDFQLDAIRAARALLTKLKWVGEVYHGGVLPNGDIVFVCSDSFNRVRAVDAPEQRFIV